LDALDECAETDFRDLIRLLKVFFLNERSKTGRVKFLLTSRPYEHVVSEFQELVKPFPSIRIPGEDASEAISQEVNIVIKHRVQQLQLSTDVRNHLERRLMKIEHRTYLWVYLVFAYLTNSGFKKTTKGIELKIATLPESVNQAYENILKKHKDRQMVQKVLSMVLVANRPLTLTEMNVAVNIDASSRSMQDLDLESEKDFYERLRSWCGLFVSIYQGKVYFLHQTAREFLLKDLSSDGRAPAGDAPFGSVPSSLEWHHSINYPQAHTVLAEACVLYLDLFNYDPDLTDANRNRVYSTRENSFLDYSAKYWSTHFREADFRDDADIASVALKICDSDSKSYPAWFNIYWETAMSVSRPGYFVDLIVASYFGRTAVVKLLLKKGIDVNAKSKYYVRTTLLWTALKGHEADVQQLLETGADAESKDEYLSQMPLSLAAENGHEAVVQRLLETGADVDTKDKYLVRTPLSLAAENGHEAVVRQLLETGKADVDSKDEYSGRTPLSWAAENGHEAVVRQLLENKADVDSKDKPSGRTPLSWAAENGHEAVVRRLLENKADVTSGGRYGWTPLQLASMNGHVEVVKLLLENKADVNSRGRYGRTPLQLASESGHVEVVKLLWASGSRRGARETT
jgi:ankyrin repeat protein